MRKPNERISSPDARRLLVAVKLSSLEEKYLREVAQQYANGNLSLFMRAALQYYEPAPEHFERTVKK